MFGRLRRSSGGSRDVAGGSQTPQAAGQSNAANAARMPGASAQGAAGQSAFGAAASGDAAWQEVLSGNRVLRKGAKGPAVQALQSRLVQMGQTIAVDGDFGGGTERAVRAVQGRLGVTVDGIVGGGTARAMSGQSPQPARGDRGAGRQQTPSPNQSTANAPTTLEEIRVRANSFERQGLRSAVFQKALNAFSTAWRAGETEKLIFTVIDYELPSTEKRFWVIDLASGRLLFHQHVAHGSGSDRNHDTKVDRVGNTPEAGTSNVGLLRTAETYHGKHGLSMRMDGLERGFNDNARRRAVVVHGADYMQESYMRAHGKPGRSLGCPALDPDVTGDVIRTIQGGSLVFAYYPDPQWLERSRFLNQ